MTTYTTIANRSSKGYLFTIDNMTHYTDCSGENIVSVQGWRMARQKINGKDGRAYPRTIRSFFGDTAKDDALAYFEKYGK